MGTVTEINDYLRLHARISHPICPNDHIEITSQSVEQMVDEVLALPELKINCWHLSFIKERAAQNLRTYQREGYVRMRVDGEVYDVSEAPELEK